MCQMKWVNFVYNRYNTFWDNVSLLEKKIIMRYDNLLYTARYSLVLFRLLIYVHVNQNFD